MRVRIKKCSNQYWWYAHHIGQVCDAEPWGPDSSVYMIRFGQSVGLASKADCVRVVRVPKELRPPSRFKAFRAENRIRDRFVVKGLFRKPKVGELYYSSPCSLSGRSFVHECDFLNETDGPRVIVERAP